MGSWDLEKQSRVGLFAGQQGVKAIRCLVYKSPGTKGHVKAILDFHESVTPHPRNDSSFRCCERLPVCSPGSTVNGECKGLMMKPSEEVQLDASILLNAVPTRREHGFCLFKDT